MLKLKNIDISGFKSFVDPVSTEFADGITAIVGPNGCGKSNLSEAITWVLGEQSAKSLRGGKMEDVIFSGTDRRKPLGMAEVSLTLETDEDIHGAENGKLIIGRRIFRSGESQYRLNDKIVRLKEIKDILADTGLGVRAYSVIEQGRIGQILSSKPTERRKLIEEAAGVTRYKARKRLAELKLEDATANRMRLDDIVSEVDRALRSLKRQSNAALRFKEREANYRQLLHTVLVGRYAVLHEKLSALGSSLTENSDADAAMGAALSSIEAELAEAREKLDQLTRDIGKRHQLSAELGAKIEGRQEFIRGTRATIGQIAERIDNGVRIAEQRQRQMHEHLEALKTLEARKQTLIDDRGQALSLVESGSSKLETAAGALKEVQAKEAEMRQSMAASSAQVNTVQQRVQRNQMDLEKAQFRSERAKTSQEEKATQIEQAKAILEESDKQTKIFEVESNQASEEATQVRAALDATVKEEAACSEACEQQRLESSQLEQRQAILEELAKADEERREGVRKAIDDIGLEGTDFLDQLLSSSRLPAKFEKSIDTFLAPYLDAVVLPADEDPVALARELAARNLDATVLRSVESDELAGDPYASLRVHAKAQKTQKAKKTVTKTRRVPIQREVQRTVEETVDVPVPVEAADVASEAPESTPALEPTPAPTPTPAPAAVKRSWLDVLLSPFRRQTAARRADAPATTTPESASTANSRVFSAAAPKTRKETRSRVITETVTDYEHQEYQVEIDVDDHANDYSGDHAPDDATAGTWCPGVAGILSDVLDLDPNLARALPPAVFAESAQIASELSVAHPHLAFLSEDALCMQAGLVRVRSEAAAPGALGRSNEMQQVGERLPLLLTEIASGKERLQELVARRTETAAKANKVASILSEKKQQLAIATARRQDQQHRVERLDAESRGIAEEHQEIAELITKIETTGKDVTSEFDTVQKAHSELEAKVEGVQAEMAKARDFLQEAKTEGEGRKSQLRLLEERVTSHAQETDRLHLLSEEVSEFLVRWAEDRTALVTRQEQMSGEVEQARVDLQRALEDRGEAEEAKVQVQQALDAQRTLLRQHEEAAATKREERDSMRAQMQELRVSEAQQKQQAEHIAETYEKEFDELLVLPTQVAVAEVAQPEAASGADDSDANEGVAGSTEAAEGDATETESTEVAAQEADAEAEPPAPLIPPNLPELIAELDNLKHIMDRMGPVNVLAAEEYTEQAERHVFLTQQRADVQASILSLRKTIEEINATSIDRFMKAFTEVNEYFGESFTNLFRGGEAGMRLQDEDDPLDSGIEIVARPPGKRLQNIQLMSGGEKALTAIALLFALFRHKPSPFCILDEVDAPLDDANCIRFIETLREMSKDTQFLVVTHNKLSMEAASTLYGVTMAEKGVSKLVGVNIDELHPAELMAS